MLQSDPSGPEDELLPYLRAINIAKNGVNLSHQFKMWIKPHEKEKFLLRKGDVLVSEGGDAGRTAHFAESGRYYFQNAINRVRPLDKETVDGRYLYYWFTFLKLAGYVDLICNVATIAHFTAEKVKASPLSFPALDTQRAIVSFLDTKTAQIDALIARKRELLARLAEKRQAIITQAVTKGLDPAAPMEDSGIVWFGDIPAHWDVKRLNSFCDFQSGKAHEPFIDPEGDYVCVNARFISTNGLAEKRCTENLCHATPNDILMVMSDLPNGRALARTFLVDDRDEYAVNQRVCRIRPQRGHPPYFSYQLNRNPQLMRHDDGNEQTHLPNAAFKQLLLLEPPLAEQQEIATYLESKRERIDTLHARVGQSIVRLQEYRAALIIEAVTGQIAGLK